MAQQGDGQIVKFESHGVSKKQIGVILKAMIVLMQYYIKKEILKEKYMYDGDRNVVLQDMVRDAQEEVHGNSASDRETSPESSSTESSWYPEPWISTPWGPQSEEPAANDAVLHDMATYQRSYHYYCQYMSQPIGSQNRNNEV